MLTLILALVLILEPARVRIRMRLLALALALLLVSASGAADGPDGSLIPKLLLAFVLHTRKGGLMLAALILYTRQPDLVLYTRCTLHPTGELYTLDQADSFILHTLYVIIYTLYSHTP